LRRLLSSYSAIAGVVGVLSFIFRVPFLFRYDLHFGGDAAICYLMALRITEGDRPFYFYGQDYQGAPEAYAAALLLKIIGPSIPVAALISLLEWSLAAGIGAYLALRGTNVRIGTVCGLAIVLGVPFTLHYVTVPYWGYAGSLLIGMLLLLQAFFIVEHGPSIRRFLIFGGTAGLGLYVGKQCIPAAIAAVIVMAVSKWPPAKRPIPSWPALGAAAIAGFLVGYSPEIWYRLHVLETRSFVATSDPLRLWENAKFTLASIPAYFNGQPVSRIPHGTNFFGHFFSHLPDSSVYPAGLLDWLSALLAFGAMTLVLGAVWTSRKNAPLLLLSMLVLINLAAVVFSNDTNGLFLSARRYLFPSAIAFSIWGGILVAVAVQDKRRWIRAAGLALGLSFAAKVVADEYTLLRSPDELSELRQIAAQLTDAGLLYGIASGHADELVAITNQRLTIVSLIYERIPEYEDIVSRSDRIAMIDLKATPAADAFVWHGATYDISGPSHESEILRWTPYRKRTEN
jgi:hypothetical protein